MKPLCVKQINVADMDKAIDFYTSCLGLKVTSKEFYPSIVELDAGTKTPLILSRVKRSTQVDYPHQAQVLFNFKSVDLENDIAELKRKGVEFIHDQPQECPVGIFAAFRDPSGNVHELIQFQE